jgi:hypothetical protein
MSFILNGYENNRQWRTYFDYIVVDAQKPLFFEEGTSLKAINIVRFIIKIFLIKLFVVFANLGSWTKKFWFSFRPIIEK